MLNQSHSDFKSVQYMLMENNADHLPVSQVQNISQSMEVLDLRTYRDLQYVRNTESLMKVVDGKLKVASDNPRGLNLKGFQVIGCPSPPVQRRVCVLLSSERRCY